MEEATEICKLRLFLKLVAQVDPDPSKPNLGVEPLPDIDFNIRAGNTLVGYTTIDEIRRSQQGKFAFSASEIARLETQAKAVADLYSLFCRLQTNGSKGETTPEELASAKHSLRREQRRLADELDRYLAADYGINADNAKKAKEFAEWRASHQPFHWFIEFYGIMQGGGFDVIIGNPPYVDYAKVKVTYQVKHYATEKCGNLYAFVLERCSLLSSHRSRVAMIVMLNITFAKEYETLRSHLRNDASELWLSTYDNIPDGLFAGSAKTESTNTNKVVSQRVCIVNWQRNIQYDSARTVHTSHFLRWNRDFRNHVFETLAYGTCPMLPTGSWVALGSSIAVGIFSKIMQSKYTLLGELLSDSGNEFLQLGATPRYFISAVPEPLNRSGLIDLRYSSRSSREIAECAYNSNLFYWFWRVTGDGFHLTRTTLTSFPFPPSLSAEQEGLSDVVRKLAAIRAQCRTAKLNKGLVAYNVNYNRVPEAMADTDRR